MKRLLTIGALFAASGVCPAHALFCGSALVNEGQRKFEVLQKCGEPAFADSHVVYASPAYGPYGYYGAAPAIPVIVDEWVYNFGPTQMMPRLVFRNGVLWTIRFHGYGSY